MLIIHILKAILKIQEHINNVAYIEKNIDFNCQQIYAV